MKSRLQNFVIISSLLSLTFFSLYIVFTTAENIINEHKKELDKLNCTQLSFYANNEHGIPYSNVDVVSSYVKRCLK